MTINFPGHVAGQPYVLTREQFAQFAGLAPSIQAIAQGLDARAAALCQEEPDPRVAFWAAIAAFEAGRTFNPLAGGCSSELQMDTEKGGQMRWEYISTSGTRMVATEWRECDTRPTPGYPGVECGELPRPAFQVLIPEERDQPGRYHWEQLRSGGTYCA